MIRGGGCTTRTALEILSSVTVLVFGRWMVFRALAT